MCGIAGYFGTSVGFDDFRALNAKLSHRGPDSGDCCSLVLGSKPLFFGHNRLAILDLSQAGHQPMQSDRFVIVFNGEIYNHLELRAQLGDAPYRGHSDTETLLRAFEAWGVEQTLQKLSGMFAFAVLDRRDSLLYMARDRVGKKPLYIAQNATEFAFASEIKALQHHLVKGPKAKAVVQFAALGYIPNGGCYFDGVRKLPPAHYAVFDGTSYKQRCYWSLPETSLDISSGDALKIVGDLLQEAVKDRMLADVEVGCFLSGGIDSSLIAAFMQKNSSRPIKTFSIGFERREYDESPHARAVAAHIGSEHIEHIFTHRDILTLVDQFDYPFDEPFGDASALPMMIVSQLASRHVKVALSGDGGDELFLGYDRYSLVDCYYRIFAGIPRPIRRLLSVAAALSGRDKLQKLSYPLANLTYENLYSLLYTALKPWELGSLFSNDVLMEAFGTTEVSLFQLLELDIDIDKNDLVGSFSRIDFLRYLPDDIMVKVDRATMWYSLEARAPLLDHRLVELAYSLPTDIKLAHGRKWILKQLLYNLVPQELVDRPKQGFGVPLKYWFRHELRDRLLSKIESLDGRFNKSFLRSLLQAHIYGNKNYEYLFWNLMRIR